MTLLESTEFSQAYQKKKKKKHPLQFSSGEENTKASH